ncbi:type 1 glutamine amidotransferase domain-containing protein [Polyangium sp. 15x6]|uniref:type 1 glutamine amidotransferase domain-containing protein n=1 Tax=Polyangium sp. 15x6 TaxID=3042687 RepID=UPI002499E562|nr:type 1 glutamine amidotransferase domain-containing protein [Polyangium sp. 15x6]MDI3288752.1 type 1 glutamine amidotransferase domain-containing protein [Polyangium sp. 15x6]
MTNRTSDTAGGRRVVLLALLAAAGLTACGGAPSPHLSDVSTSKSKEKAMTKRVLIATTSHDKKGDTGESTGAYLPEVAHPYAVFKEAGYTIDFASVKGGQVPLDGVDRKDPVQAAFLDDAQVVARLHASAPAEKVDPAAYDAIFFAGGHGTMWDFPDNAAFASVAAKIYERGGVVAAVCHGPAALVNVRLSTGEYLVAGKQVSAFTNEEERAVKLEKVVPFLLEDKLVERGARFVPAPNWQKQVVVSERLVTGQNPASAAGVAEATVKLLEK